MKPIYTKGPLETYSSMRRNMCKELERFIDNAPAGSRKKEKAVLTLKTPVMIQAHFGGFADGDTPDSTACAKHGQKAGYSVLADTLMLADIGYGEAYFVCNRKAYTKQPSDIVNLEDLHLTELALIADHLP